VAAVMLQTEAALDANTLMEWINNRVEARFQIISAVVIVDQLPRNVAGKTLKNVLKENYLANQK